MALTDAEIARIKYELGENVLSVGAVPYIGVSRLYEVVIQPNMLAGATTTSATSVTASTSPAVAALTLADATGFTAGARIAVDVDDAQEVVTVRSVAGSVLSVWLSKAHTGTYPVTVEGGESIVREILARCRAASIAISEAITRSGVKKADDVEFFAKREGSDVFTALREQQAHWREELRRALGVRGRRDNASGARFAI